MERLSQPEDAPGGATPLDPDEFDGLKLKYISTRSQLDAAEFDNIADSQEWSRRSAKRGPSEILSTGSMVKLHTRMFGQVWLWAGKWRTRGTNIGVEPHLIAEQVAAMLGDAQYWDAHHTYPTDEIAVRTHHRLVKIHPFANGNGRTTRQLADLYLQSVGATQFTWGGSRLSASRNRETYIRILKATDKSGDYEEIIEFARSPEA